VGLKLTVNSGWTNIHIINRSFTAGSTPHPIFSDDQIEKNELAGACSTYGERKVVYSVLLGKPEGKNYLENPGVYIRILLRWIFRKWGVGVWTGSRWFCRHL